MDQTQLRHLEDKCIQESPPWCESSCPIHVDVRAMCKFIALGDFESASNIIRKTIPFPYIISRICDHPCEVSCKRKEAGEPISIRFLERAVMTYGGHTRPKTRRLPPRAGRVAIVGSGLSGLTVALDLVRKGYKTSLFEGTSKLGGSIHRFSDYQLKASEIESDFNVFNESGLTTEMNRRLGTDVSLEELRQEFDAIYLGIGSQPLETSIDKVRSVISDVDFITFATPIDGVFAGGNILRTHASYSPVMSVSDGRRAAISIDRYLQGVSLTASRDAEGPHETRLYTRTERVVPSSRVHPIDSDGGYTKDEAVLEASRCIQCECLECVKVCEFLASFKAYPRKYVRQIYNNLSIVMGQRHGNKLTNSCSLCGLCKEVCPESLDMGEICRSARETMVVQKRMPPSAHEFAIRDMEFSNGPECSLWRHQPGTLTSAYLFFPGCRLSGSSPDNVERAYRYLIGSLEGGVGLVLGCCGAPAEWAGQKDRLEGLNEEFSSNWNSLGQPIIITACSSCHDLFQRFAPNIRPVSLWQIFDMHGLPETSYRQPIQGKFALHDPCSSRHESVVQQSVRNLLNKLGVCFEELPLNRNLTECCGYGGLMRFANQELSERVADRRAFSSLNDYIAYCAVCQDHFKAQGKKTFHMLEIIFGSTGVGENVKIPVDYSTIRNRRKFLKRSLLDRLWGETVSSPRENIRIKLYLSGEVRDILSSRMILDDDVRQVIDYAEKSGRKLLNRSNGHFLAHHAPSKVTYWVEYSAKDDGFEVHGAYSHRMQVVEENR